MSSKISKEYWYIITAGTLSGLIVFGGQVFKDLGFSLLEMSVILYFPTVFFLLPFVWKKGRQLTDFGNIKLAFFWAAVGFPGVITQFGAVVAGASVAVVLLLYTQPIWTILISKFFLKTKITKKDIISIFLALVGVIFLVTPWKVDPGSLLGIFIALLGGISLSGWVLVGSYIGQKKADPYVIKYLQTFMVVILSTISLIILAKIIDQQEIITFTLSWPLKIWLLILAFNLLTQPISHILYLKGSKKVPAKESGIILLLEPLVGALLATIFLHQPLTGSIILGGIFILISNYLVIRKA